MAIVDAAAEAGAHVLKLQTYTADSMTIDIETPPFLIDDPDSLWTGESLYTLYERAHTPWDWHAEIFERADAAGMLCFSSPFDESAVDFLEDLRAPAYKIASFENTDLPLVRKVAATGKPVIISIGMATLTELEETLEAARQAGCEELMLLQCTSSYPATPDGSNVRTIPDLRDRFGVEVGLSDHTRGIGVALASIPLGATLIEKHLTLDRRDGAVDSPFSIEPDEFARLVVESERAWRGLGEVLYGPEAQERGSLLHRRTLYITEDLSEGDLLTPQNLRRIRPGGGLPCKHYESLLARPVLRDVVRGTPMSWELVGDGEGA